MKILVTGANGYLGQGIVRKLTLDGNDVIATDIMTNNISGSVQKVKCNLFEIKDPYLFFEKPDVLLHLAWRDGFLHNSNAHIDDLPGHVHFIKTMAESGVKQIAVMGSMHEIGFYEGCINENTICHPASLYGIAKDCLRKATELITGQNNIIFQWLRGFYIVGNSEYGSSIFSKIAKAEKAGQKDFPFTTGTNQYDFIDYDDFCNQVAAAIEQNKTNGIINICSGFPEKLGDRVERFIADNGYKIKLNYGAYPDRPYDSKAVWGNNEKIRDILDAPKRQN